MTNYQFKFQSMGLQDPVKYRECAADFAKFCDIYLGIGDSQQEAAYDAVAQVTENSDIPDDTYQRLVSNADAFDDSTESVDESKRLSFVQWCRDNHDGTEKSIREDFEFEYSLSGERQYVVLSVREGGRR